MNIRRILLAVAGLLFLLIAWGSFEIIAPSERAVKVTMGTVADKVYDPGVQMKLPIVSHFETASVEPITQDVFIEVGPKGAVSADNQTIGLQAKVAWNYDTNRVMELVKQYPNRSTLEDLVNNTAYEALKVEIGKYTIFDLAKNAAKIATEARAAAAAKVKAYPVLITQVNLTNWDWSDDFDAQIKATMNTTQRVAQAKAEADRVEQEQRAQSIKAEAGAKALIAQAEGEKQAEILRADAKRAQGQGIADYNRSIAQTMDIQRQLLELEIEKIRAGRWDGRQVPWYVPLNAAGTVVELPSPLKK